VTLEALAASLASGTPRAVYLLAGPEALLRDDALALLRRALLEPGSADFNLDRLDGATASAADLENAVRALPVFAKRRLVILREPEAGRANRALADALAHCIEELRALPDPSCVLVIAAGQVDRRARWVKAVGDDGILSCEAPQRRPELIAFVKREAARQGASIEAAAAELLAERIGPELLLLRQELAKAVLLAGEGSKIEREHIAVSSADIAEEPIWDLTDAIGGGDAASALALLAKLLRTGAAPQPLLGALASHFRRLLRVRSGGDVAAPPFVRKKLEGQARRYSPPRLEAALRAIHETDRALKGEGAIAPDLALERLVLGLL
jgi:DNA polymerase-3 subunit delta